MDYATQPRKHLKLTKSDRRTLRAYSDAPYQISSRPSIEASVLEKYKLK